MEVPAVRIRRIAVALAAAVAVLASIPVAHASDSSDSTADASDGIGSSEARWVAADEGRLDSRHRPVSPGRHCAIGLQPVDAGQPASVAPAPSVHCFDGFDKAVAHATGGEVQLGVGATLADAEATLAASSTSVLGIHYDRASYEGNSKVIFGRGDGCYAGQVYWVRDLRELGFDNRVSSSRMFANCLGRHYSGYNGGGDSFLCEGSCPGLGSMNNRSSSIKYF